jgi:predicted NBD/HSP70 family sugar kinase
MYVSGIGLLAGVREHAAQFPDSPLSHDSEPSTSDILEAAAHDDALAWTVLNESTDWFVTVLGYCAALFNPSLFVIGGGLGHAARQFFVEQAAERLQQRVLPATRASLRVVESKVQHSAIGAACLVWYAQENRG